MQFKKTLTDRLKITPRGKILARQPGQNHFRAKASRVKKLGKKRLVTFTLRGIKFKIKK